MKTNWKVLTLNRVRASKSFFALNQNIFSAQTAPEASRFGATRIVESVTYAAKKLADKKRMHLV